MEIPARQQDIVSQLEAEQALVDGCKRLTETAEHKIKAKIAELWGELPVST